MKLREQIINTLRVVPNFPKEGIQFYDIASLLSNKELFRRIIDAVCNYVSDTMTNKKLSEVKIVGIDSRGFIFGAPVASNLMLPFVMARKPGKLPGETLSQSYALEYGEDSICLQKVDINPGDNVIVVDDLIATGGSADAVMKLVERMGANPISVVCVLGLPACGYKNIDRNYDCKVLVDLEGK